MNAKKVLIVEDDRDICEIVELVLAEEGYEVVSSTCLEPLDQLKDVMPDLILLDEWVNEKEGQMLCKEIKKIHQFLHIPVIIFSTAWNIEEIVETCQANGFIRKPFDVSELVAEVNRYLSKRPGQLLV
jgi:DNA-binding response OmpR family regulator